MSAPTAAAPETHHIIVCGGTSCHDRGTAGLAEAVRSVLAAHGLEKTVGVSVSGCLGMCDRGPLLIIDPGHVVYGSVTPATLEKIIVGHIVHDRPATEHVVEKDHLYNRFFRVFGDVNFFGRQMRIVLRNCGIIDPESIDDYFAVRGYEALARVLAEKTPAETIAEVKRSGLRGRGGAGFSTGLKWELTAREPGPERFVICNADEGDPGAFMDRSAIEGDPHTLIEGMIIGGYAISARRGIIYIRAEYPLAIARLEKALVAARAEGILGERILETDFSFDIEIRLGAGAFVCGEETALIRSIEGGRGMPRPRPPYPSVAGLFGRPTLINNVETWANIPVIMLDGAEWFRSIGTETSKGTKVFALAGKIKNTGLVEVPMGTTLRRIIYEIGGGLESDRPFKAIQTGGPSGGCLPDEYLDTMIDYESLAKAGSIMGSGGMIVMDEDSCMVHIARFFLEFTQNESCGKCTPCREGTKRMLEILERITAGRGAEGDIEKLIRLGEMIQKSSLCGLGQSAPNPVISTIKNFRAEYEEHIRERRCRAGVCAAMVKYAITDACTGCTVCRRVCPTAAIAGERKQKHVIDREKCVGCGACYDICKFAAIVKTH